MASILYLNKKQIDLGNVKMVRDIRIGDVGQLNAQKSNKSYTLNIPPTSKNLEVLDMLGVLGNTSRKPYEFISCDYIVEGFFLVENGRAVIRSKKGKIQLNILDGFINLSDRLAGLKLKDLPFSDINHILSLDTVINSFENTEGYIYGIANFGIEYNPLNVPIEHLAPCIFTHSIFRRIFENSNLNLIGDFFTTNTQFLNEVLTISKGYEVLEIDENPIDKGTGRALGLYDYIFQYDPIYSTKKFNLIDIDLVDETIVDSNLIFSNSGTYELELEIDHIIKGSDSKIIIKKNNSQISYVYLGVGTGIKRSTVTLEVLAGDEISIFLEISDTTPINGAYEIDYLIKLDFHLYVAAGGNLIEPIKYIGDINQLDFIKDVMFRYGLIIRSIANTEEFEFVQIETVLNDREGAEDWTDKIAKINDSDFRLNYAKNNRASFSYPESTIIPTNDGNLILNNYNLNPEKSLFKSFLEIPEQSGLINSEPFYIINLRKNDSGIISFLETKPKILNINRLDKSLKFTFYNLPAGGVEVGVGVPYFNLDNVNMQYYINSYYQALGRLLNDYELREFIVNLSVIDIYNLNFFKLKYIKQIGRYVYLKNIRYKEGELATVKAYEIKNF